MRIFNSISFAAFRSNGDLIDRTEYDGTVGGVQNAADDVKSFVEVWEPGESYTITVNGHEVDQVDYV